MIEMTEIPQEGQKLLRDFAEAAKTLLDSGGDMKSGVEMFRMFLRQEALRRTENNQCKAARILREHRNTLGSGLRVRRTRVSARAGGKQIQ
jgi:DNA-binding protein Fis